MTGRNRDAIRKKAHRDADCCRNREILDQAVLVFFDDLLRTPLSWDGPKHFRAVAPAAVLGVGQRTLSLDPRELRRLRPCAPFRACSVKGAAAAAHGDLDLKLRPLI